MLRDVMKNFFIPIENPRLAYGTLVLILNVDC